MKTYFEFPSKTHISNFLPKLIFQISLQNPYLKFPAKAHISNFPPKLAFKNSCVGSVLGRWTFWCVPHWGGSTTARISFTCGLSGGLTPYKYPAICNFLKLFSIFWQFSHFFRRKNRKAGVDQHCRLSTVNCLCRVNDKHHFHPTSLAGIEPGRCRSLGGRSNQSGKATRITYRKTTNKPLPNE